MDITQPDSKQYKGWPITISQMDNFNPKETLELPTLNISSEDQVVTVRNSSTQEVISSLRIKGKTYQPKVLRDGLHTIEIEEGNTPIKLFDVKAEKQNRTILKVKI